MRFISAYILQSNSGNARVVIQERILEEGTEVDTIGESCFRLAQLAF